MTTTSPVKPSERHVILDLLRGIALLGICIANFQEFSLYSFQSVETAAAMSTAGVDRAVKFLVYLFIDGKFYTLFSLLFGIGFSIILSKNSGSNRFYYRRMLFLFLFGLFHLIFLWAGDILILYAAVGLLLPLMAKMSDRKLIAISALLILLPVAVDGCIALFGWNPAAPVEWMTARLHERSGITAENFPVWLAEKESYRDVLRFNTAGAFIRVGEFIDGHRALKVLGIFLLGFCAGRRKVYVDCDGNRKLLRRIAIGGFVVGFPASMLYAWEAVNGHPFGPVWHSAVYAVSVVPFSLSFAASVCLLYFRRKESRLVSLLAAPGRMALTNYLAQSLFGMVVFYGIGAGFGAKTGLVCAVAVAIAVYAVQVMYSVLWLRRFRYGPLEWVWRMLSYGKRLDIKRQ